MTEPTKIQRAIALNGTKNAIPILDPALGDGKACYDKGFGLLNFTPKTSGGIPPWGADMNGLLFEQSNVIKFLNSGGTFLYDATFQTAISGYPIGAVLRKANLSGLWICTADANMTNPDTGGAGWAQISPDWYADAGGTTSAYTATFVPTVGALTEGLTVVIDTGAVGTNAIIGATFSPNGLTARTITKQNGVALAVGDMPKFAQLIYDATSTTWTLLNPAINGGMASIQVFSTAGTFTYTPTAGTKQVEVEVQGGGGGGGGSLATTTTTQMCAGTGAGAGGYGISRITSGFSGVTVTVGAAGAGVSGANGTAGGTSSFGAFISATGGTAGKVGVSYTVPQISSGTGVGVGGAGTGGNIYNIQGADGKHGLIFTSSAMGGEGGASKMGMGGRTIAATTSSPVSSAGNPATGQGAGGGGGVSTNVAAASAGGAGTAGIVIIREFM